MNSATSHHDSEYPPHGANYSDSSGALFSMYLSRAEKYDKEKAESWKADADGILVFTGLFSATVAAFIIESYGNLQPDPSAVSVSLLIHISQQLAGLSNGTHVDAAGPLALTQPSFRPPASAVWVNALWFLSLVASLTCALLATLLQQWARRYLHRTQRRYAPHARARIRAFFAEGADRYHIATVVELLPALLHVAVFLFFAGLVVFVFDIHRGIAAGILALVVGCGLAYAVLTVFPVIFHDGPFQTPLSTAAWYLCHLFLRSAWAAGEYVLVGAGKVAAASTQKAQKRLAARAHHSGRCIAVGMGQCLEDTARQQSWGVDARALAWTLDTLDEDHELEQFMAGVPGFYASKAMTAAKVVLGSLSGPKGSNAMLPWKILQVIEHTADSTASLSRELRQQRSRACIRALYFIPGAVHDVLSALRNGSAPPTVSLLFSTDSWAIAGELSRHPDDGVALPARCVAAVIATQATFSDTLRATALRDDARSFAILVEQLGVQEHVLQAYLDGSAQNIRLANLVSFVWLTAHLARRMEAALRAWTEPQQRAILAERAALLRARMVWRWDGGSGGADPGELEGPAAARRRARHTASPPLSLAVNHDLLRLTLEYLSDAGFYDAPARELLDELRDAWRYVEGLRRDARRFGQSAHSLAMVLDVLRPLCAQLLGPGALEVDAAADVGVKGRGGAAARVVDGFIVRGSDSERERPHTAPATGAAVGFEFVALEVPAEPPPLSAVSA